MKKDVAEIEKKLSEYGKKLEALQINIDNDSEPKAKKIDNLLSSLIKMKTPSQSPITTPTVNTQVPIVLVNSNNNNNVNKNLSNSRTNLNIHENTNIRPLPTIQQSHTQPTQTQSTSSSKPFSIGFEGLLYGDFNNNNDLSYDSMATLRNRYVFSPF
jgi:hypothetical protein